MFAASSDTKVYNNTFQNNKQHLYVNDETGRVDSTLSNTPELRVVRTEVVNNILMDGGKPAFRAAPGGPFAGKGGAPAPSKNRFSILDFNVYRDAPTPVFDWRLASGADTTYATLAAFRAAPPSDTGDFETRGVQRTVGSVFENVLIRDFRVPGSDVTVARNGRALPAPIRSMRRDQIPFVGDALTDARCDLAQAATSSLGAAPSSGTYRGAFKPAP